jgi:hypothetical protein
MAKLYSVHEDMKIMVETQNQMPPASRRRKWGKILKYFLDRQCAPWD